MNKMSNIKYSKLPAKVAEEILRNKLLVYLIDHMDTKNPYICYPTVHYSKNAPKFENDISSLGVPVLMFSYHKK